MILQDEAFLLSLWSADLTPRRNILGLIEAYANNRKLQEIANLLSLPADLWTQRS